MAKKISKNMAKVRAQVEDRPYSLQDAVPLLKKVQYAKFDETVDLTLRLGVDPKHADQMVRGTVVLPHGLGKTKKVAVIASGDRLREAEAAGADSLWAASSFKARSSRRIHWSTSTDSLRMRIPPET